MNCSVYLSVAKLPTSESCQMKLCGASLRILKILCQVKYRGILLLPGYHPLLTSTVHVRSPEGKAQAHSQFVDDPGDVPMHVA